eukprot:TRINITY_DN12_c1_g1_i1.p1 TRINITY_DN12_c1_g1~~TRINITY_DN12_c1_g1_i1.p1  ORF type:complete len:221 (+),score=-75.03 TRINITY_DN12_c1_g1_i1:1320-1982(+)
MYSSSYIIGDKFSNRFCLLVLLFIFSMALLIFRPRLISLLLGWDGLGVSSYLLVCYYRSEKRYNASMLTAITNRIGDVLILILISISIGTGIVEFTLIGFRNYLYSWPLLLILLIAITKRAQVPFSSWLPAAIAAPTPVSALVHSSTLVTAGVYLLVRFNFTLNQSILLLVMIIVASMTMLIAGLSATIELDIKKVIALSTLSQLGVIVFTLALGLISLS